MARSGKTLPERMTVFLAYERARKGPKVDEKVWDFEIIPQTAKRLKEKHGIQMDKKVMIPTDPDLIDRLYKAGLEMLVECGVYAIETGQGHQVDRGRGPVHRRRARPRARRSVRACIRGRSCRGATTTRGRRSSRAVRPARPSASSTSSASMSRTPRRASSTASSTACSRRSTATTRSRRAPGRSWPPSRRCCWSARPRPRRAAPGMGL